MAYEIILLTILALAYSVLSLVLQYTLGNRRRVQQIQKDMQDLQKEFQKAAQSGDEKEIKRLEEKQKHMTGLMLESMKYQFKPMLVILPSFLIMFGGFGFEGILFSLFPGFNITLPIALHLDGSELLGLNVLHNSHYGVRGFFLVILFFSGILLQLAVVPIAEKLFYGPKQEKTVQTP
ncbi:DUF106 domain-containing protein [Candidatus Micrarchaeota archaeon]|nr:DUF106 domain-containing protein [Candidatus Micrarchaeota archaeon]